MFASSSFILHTSIAKTKALEWNSWVPHHADLQFAVTVSFALPLLFLLLLLPTYSCRQLLSAALHGHALQAITQRRSETWESEYRAP